MRVLAGLGPVKEARRWSLRKRHFILETLQQHQSNGHCTVIEMSMQAMSEASKLCERVASGLAEKVIQLGLRGGAEAGCRVPAAPEVGVILECRFRYTRA